MIDNKSIGWMGDEPTEIVINTFNERIIKPGDRLLDIGCGFGRNSNWLAGKGVIVTAININDDEIKQAKIKAQELQVNVNYIHANAVSLPFPDSSFEVALDLGCTHMITNRNRQVKAMKETARILTPGGYLIYFGFSKNHPSYMKNKKKSMFRSFKDIQDMYGSEFETLSHEETRWEPRPEEYTNFKEHTGVNVVMKRK
ncbi:class I SAM-dependent methyltransferase [Patescibacteria group bacterium]